MKLRQLALVSLFALPLLARPLDARAESAPASEAGETEEARQHFTEGLKLYKDGDFDAALVQFERAYSSKPNYKVLYNIAQTYFQLRQYVEARDAMARYLKEGGSAIESDRQASVNKDLADLEKRIAKITVTVNVTGATVLVDGKKVGVTPLSDPIPVSEGQRTISIETEKRGARQRLIRVAGGEQQTLTIDFETLPTASTTANTPSQSAAKSGPGAAFWITGAGALALGAGAGVTGFLALKAQNDNKDQQKQFGVSPSTLNDSNNRAKNMALVSDVLTGAAVACAGVAVVLLVTSHHPESPQVSLSVGPGNANLFGSF